MKNSFLSYLVLAISLVSLPAISQTESDTTLLGLPGDNLDLFAVLNLFQQSPTIEDFEKTINLEETGVNNLDLDLDDKVDFIKVVTKQDGDDFAFVLQVDVSETEVQDVAVILVSKDADAKITMQVVGDQDLYGEDYVIEPAPPAPKVTANPAYTGNEPVPSTPETSTVIVVESAPIVQYVYSPVYVPYYPPYTYAYHPPYFAAFTVMAVGIYHHNNYYHHYGYHGGYHGGNTVVIHNNNTYNNYNNNSRNSSNTVNRNNANGNYNNNRSSASTRPSTGNSAATRPSTGASASQRPSTGTSAAARPSTSTANRAASPSASQSRSASPSPSAGSSYSGGGSRSMSSSPSRSGGAARPSGGGGGGRRR